MTIGDAQPASCAVTDHNCLGGMLKGLVWSGGYDAFAMRRAWVQSAGATPGGRAGLPHPCSYIKG